MTTITVEIEKEKDLPALQEVLSKMGLKYHVEEDEEDDWDDLPEAAIEGIKAGLADGEAGRIHSHEYVMAYMEEKLKRLRTKNG
jgi:predicted transcriptional regulator